MSEFVSKLHAQTSSATRWEMGCGCPDKWGELPSSASAHRDTVGRDWKLAPLIKDAGKNDGLHFETVSELAGYSRMSLRDKHLSLHRPVRDGATIARRSTPKAFGVHAGTTVGTQAESRRDD